MTYDTCMSIATHERCHYDTHDERDDTYEVRIMSKANEVKVGSEGKHKVVTSAKVRGKRALAEAVTSKTSRDAIAQTQQDAANVVVTPPVVASKGRAKLVDTLSIDEVKGQVEGLLSRLRVTTDANEKKKLRRALRLRGHRGGLTHEKTANVVNVA